MQTIIESIELVHIHNACRNALRSSTGIQGRTRMRLDGIIAAVAPTRESFEKHWPAEVKKHVLHVDGEAQQSGGDYIYTSPEAEEEYKAYVSAEHTIEVDLLSKAELENIITTEDQFGSADFHFRSLQLVTEGFARVPEKQLENDN